MKFHERIRMCPEQCVRYQFGSDPLWPCDSKEGRDLVDKAFSQYGKGTASRNRAAYKFEMQLMPQLLYYLTR